MASLLSTTDKAALVSAYENLVDTFKRPIVVYHEAEKTVVISDPNYNRLRKFSQNTRNPDNTPVSRTINARIYYASKQGSPFNTFGQSPQNKAKIDDGMVRIKIHADDFEFMSKAKKIELDGNLFDVDSVERPHGLFDTEYYTYWLKRSQ